MVACLADTSFSVEQKFLFVGCIPLLAQVFKFPIETCDVTSIAFDVRCNPANLLKYLVVLVFGFDDLGIGLVDLSLLFRPDLVFDLTQFKKSLATGIGDLLDFLVLFLDRLADPFDLSINLPDLVLALFDVLFQNIPVKDRRITQQNLINA